MSPALLILGLFAVMVSFVVLAIIGLDNWNRGNRRFAAAMFALCVLAIMVANGAIDQIDRAYQERVETRR